MYYLNNNFKYHYRVKIYQCTQNIIKTNRFNCFIKVEGSYNAEYKQIYLYLFLLITYLSVSK